MKRSKPLSTSVAILLLAACGGESTPEPRSSDAVATEMPPTPYAGGDTASNSAQPMGTPPGGPNESAALLPGPVAVTPEPAPAPALTDAQVAAISDAANAGEIEQAKIAQKRGKDAGVKKFAAMMIAHHTEAMQKQAKLLSKLNVRPEETPESMALAAEGTEVLESLKTADAASFDAAYIASQVDAHQKVLIKFDTRLIPSAKNADLRALLEEFRPRVEAHLKEAKEIQRALPVKAVGMNR